MTDPEEPLLAVRESLKILYLPPSVPSISYRPWAHDLRGFRPLRWFCEKLSGRYGNRSLVVACHDEIDRELAQPIAAEFGLLVAVCQGKNILQALGELACVAGARPLVYFHVEGMFGPAALLDRVLAHHLMNGNQFTHVADIPDLLCPEVIEPGLARALASLSFTGRIPSPREVVSRMVPPALRAVPYEARLHFGVARCAGLHQFAAPEDVDRTRQAVADLPPEHKWEAVERWQQAKYIPEPLAISTRSPATRTRILYVAAGSFYSGAEECLRGLVQQLAKTGFEQVAVVGVEGVFADRLRETGCEVAAANCNLLTSTRTLAAQVFDAVRPSILHANGTVGNAFLQLARERSVPVILHVRSGVFRDTSRLHAADRLIAVSGFARDQLIRAGVPERKISLVYEGVDVDRFTPGCLDKKQGRVHFDLAQDAFVVLMIARPTASKRHDLMIDAFAALRASGVDACLVFVGDFGDASFLNEMQIKVHRLQLQQHVRWLPFQHDIRAIECTADAIALPSDFEALGMCSLEAMALGIPAIVSSAGGGQELVEHGVSGLVMRGGDAGSLASALELLATDRALRDAIGCNGRRRAIERFSLRRHAQHMTHIFEGALRL